jgi:hypothetical protein
VTIKSQFRRLRGRAGLHELEVVIQPGQGVEFTKEEEQWFKGGQRAPPFFFFFFFFFSKQCRFWGVFFKLLFFFFFSKWHFSNLIPKNDVVLYFSPNLTVLTNGWGQNTTVR